MGNSCGLIKHFRLGEISDSYEREIYNKNFPLFPAVFPITYIKNVEKPRKSDAPWLDISCLKPFYLNNL